MRRSNGRRPRVLRPAGATVAYSRPNARATASSTGSTSNVASARWRRSWRRARSPGSAVACGPAESSASVTAEIASSPGRTPASIRPSAMTTDVSRTPRAWRRSGTRLDALVERRVDVRPEPLEIERRRVCERRDGRLRADEPPAAKRDELGDLDAVARHGEGLAAVECAHDVAALVPQLTLADASCHASSVARVLQRL